MKNYNLRKKKSTWLPPKRVLTQEKSPQMAPLVYSCHVPGRLQAFGGCACHFMTTDPPTYGLPAVLAAMRMDCGYRCPACGPGQQGRHRVTAILVYLFIMFLTFFFSFLVSLGMYFNSLFIGFIGCTHVPHPQNDKIRFENLGVQMSEVKTIIANHDPNLNCYNYLLNGGIWV